MLTTIDHLRTAIVRHVEAGELAAADDTANELAAASQQAQVLILHLRRLT
jgi:hypothetical protein